MESKEIKCHLCGGIAVLKHEDLSLDNGKILVRGSGYYKCKKCGEEFSTSEQMHELSSRLNSKFSFSRPLINAGRSLAITIPKDIVDSYNLKKGKSIRIVPESGKKIELILE